MITIAEANKVIRRGIVRVVIGRETEDRGRTGREQTHLGSIRHRYYRRGLVRRHLPSIPGYERQESTRVSDAVLLRLGTAAWTYDTYCKLGRGGRPGNFLVQAWREVIKKLIELDYFSSE